MKQSRGLFDIQVNGFAGVDFNDEKIDADQLDHALEAMLGTGVTMCLPTLITASFDVLEARLTALDNAIAASSLGPLMIPGYHLEGPFLNPQKGYAGCHPAQAMCVPQAKKVLGLEKHLQRPILLITYAPEFDEKERFAGAMREAGKCLSIGHSAASLENVEKAVSAGVRLSTHLGNALPQNMHKFINPLFAQLGCDTLYAGFIADGIHIPFYVLKSLLRAKGEERSILVTDATSAAASDAGFYRFAGMQIQRLQDGSVRVPGSTQLSGSGLTMDQAIRNLVECNLAGFKAAVRMASENPYQLMAETFKRHATIFPSSSICWDELYRVRVVQTGGREWCYDKTGNNGQEMNNALGS